MQFDQSEGIPEWFLQMCADYGMWGAARTGGMVEFGVLHEEIGRGWSSCAAC